MMITTQGLPGLDLDGRTALRGPVGLAGLGANPNWNVPPQPSDYYAIAGWVQQYLKPAVKVWWNDVQSQFGALGMTVSNVVSTLDNPNESLRINYTVTKNGVSVDELIQGGNDASGYSPAEYAKRVHDLSWQWKYQYTGAAAQQQTQTADTSRTSSRTDTKTGATTTPTSQTSQVPLIPAGSSTRTGTRETSRPQETTPTEQPGEVPANTTTSTADKLAGGAADDKQEAESKDDGGIFSASFKVGDMEIPVVLAIAVVGAAFVMSSKGGK